MSLISIQFGVASGLGLFPMTFDWSQIAYIGSPLVVPFWAALNIVGGLVVVMWVMAPIMCKQMSFPLHPRFFYLHQQIT